MIENIRTCNTCNNMYLNQSQNCPYCSTPINHYPISKFVKYLMYFKPTLSIAFLLSSYFIAQMVLGFCSYIFFPELSQQNSVTSDTVSLLITIISNLIFILILSKYSPYRSNYRSVKNNSFNRIFTTFGLFILCISFLELSLTFIEHFFDLISLPPSLSSPYDNYLENTNNAIIFSFLVILIGPIFEEIVFRQHINAFLESSIDSKLFIILTSGLIFSLNHLPADLLNGSFRFTFEHLYVVFILGIVLGVIYYKYGLLFAIIFHSLWNTFSLLTQIESLIPDPVLLSNMLLVIGLTSITILPGFFIYRKNKKIKESLWKLFSKKISRHIWINLVLIILYEVLIAILLVTYQNLISIFFLLVIHTLGIILGFIVLDTEFRVSSRL